MDLKELGEFTSWLTELADFAELGDCSMTFHINTAGHTCMISVRGDDLEAELTTRDPDSPFGTGDWLSAKNLATGPINKETWQSIKNAIMEAEGLTSS